MNPSSNLENIDKNEAAGNIPAGNPAVESSVVKNPTSKNGAFNSKDDMLVSPADFPGDIPTARLLKKETEDSDPKKNHPVRRRIVKIVLVLVFLVVLAGAYLFGSWMVLDQAKKAELKLPEKIELEPDESITFEYHVDPYTVTFDFSSENPYIISVNGDQLTALASGDTTIQATWSYDGFFSTGIEILGGKREESFPVHVHGYDSVSSELATCTKEGYSIATCSCGKQKSEILPALGHDYEVKETKATCSEDGKAVYTCRRCFRSYTKVLKSTGHDWTEWAVEWEPTCTVVGWVSRICSVCGEQELQEIDATGHSYGEWTSSGNTHSHTCSVCGETETVAHEGSRQYNNNYHWDYCSVCGASYNQSAHNLTYISSETVEETTWNIYQCTGCGYTYREIAEN